MSQIDQVQYNRLQKAGQQRFNKRICELKAEHSREDQSSLLQEIDSQYESKLSKNKNALESQLIEMRNRHVTLLEHERDI